MTEEAGSPRAAGGPELDVRQVRLMSCYHSSYHSSLSILLRKQGGVDRGGGLAARAAGKQADQEICQFGDLM